MTKGSKLYPCIPHAGAEWVEVAEFPQKISRVAMITRGNQIAVVAEEP